MCCTLNSVMHRHTGAIAWGESFPQKGCTISALTSWLVEVNDTSFPVWPDFYDENG